MSTSFTRSSLASPQAIARLRERYRNLPEPYVSFLERINGAEGELGVEPGWFVIWPAEEAAIATDEYQMPTYLPGYFTFGGNGGGELFVFSLGEDNQDRPVFMVPAIGMALEELQQIAPSFVEFEAQLGKALA